MMNLIIQNPQSGYIALISAIVIMFLLITITISLGFISFFGRFDILDSESKERSMALAEACVSQAKLDASYATYYSTLTDFTIPSSTSTCKRSVVQNSGQIRIKAQGEFNKSFTNLRVVLDDSTFAKVSWEECDNLTSNPASC